MPRPDSSLFDALGSQPRPSTSGSIVPHDQRKTRSPVVERQSKVMKAFARVAAKKSILVLTEKADVKKAIMNSLLAVGTDLCFAKSATTTWQRLQDPKESFHALIWDLNKSEVSVNGLLRNIRAHERYSRLPIIVLTSEREISDAVRLACSFVVFHPVAPAMLREALLWCFDRKVLTGMTSKQETVDSYDFLVGPAKSMDAWPASPADGDCTAPTLALKGTQGREVKSEAFMVCDT